MFTPPTPLFPPCFPSHPYPQLPRHPPQSCPPVDRAHLTLLTACTPCTASAISRRRARLQPQLVTRDAKLRELPVLVLMPGKELLYAHKLLPEEEALTAAFPPAVKCADSGGDDGGGGGDGGVSGGGGDTEMRLPESVAEDIWQRAGATVSAAADGPAGGEQQPVGDGDAASAAVAAEPPRRPRSQRRAGRSALAAELHAERQAARLEARQRALAQPAEPQVRGLFAGIARG